MPARIASPDAPARPKSVMRTCPSPSSMTLAGLRSRWTTPRSCAAARPAQIWRAISSARSSGKRPMRRSSEARSSPSTYSIERNVRAVDLVDVVDAADVGMRHLPGHADFGVQLRQPGRIAVDVGRQELQRDRLAELEIVGAIDLAHAAAAERVRRCDSGRRGACRARSVRGRWRPSSRASQSRRSRRWSSVRARRPAGVRGRRRSGVRMPAASSHRDRAAIIVSMSARRSGVWQCGHRSPALLRHDDRRAGGAGE